MARKKRASVVLPTKIEREAPSPRKTPNSDAQARQRVMDARKKTLAEHHKKTAHLHPKTNWKKIFFWIVIIILIIIIWKQFDIPGLFLHLIQLNPTVWAFYQELTGEIAGRTYAGLFYASLLSTFILTNPLLPIPPEVIYVLFLQRYYFVQVLAIMLIGNLISMALNYFIGSLIGERVVKFFMKKSYGSFKKKLDKAGVFFVLIGNIIPFPMEPFAVFLGAVKFGFKRFMIYTLIGRLIKFLLLTVGLFYFTKYASPFLGTISVEWFVEGVQNLFSFW